jgi:hypothetical protein
MANIEAEISKAVLKRNDRLEIEINSLFKDEDGELDTVLVATNQRGQLFIALNGKTLHDERTPEIPNEEE